MPFADYDSMSDCKRAHSDKEDPGAYCAQIYKNVTGDWPGQSEAADFYDDPSLFVKHALESLKETGQDPTEDKLSEMRRTEQQLLEAGP